MVGCGRRSERVGRRGVRTFASGLQRVTSFTGDTGVGPLRKGPEEGMKHVGYHNSYTSTHKYRKIMKKDYLIYIVSDGKIGKNSQYKSS